MNIYFHVVGAALLVAGIVTSVLGEAGTTFAAMVLFSQYAYYAGRFKERANAQSSRAGKGDA